MGFIDRYGIGKKTMIARKNERFWTAKIFPHFLYFFGGGRRGNIYQQDKMRREIIGANMQMKSFFLF